MTAPGDPRLSCQVPSFGGSSFGSAKTLPTPGLCPPPSLSPQATNFSNRESRRSLSLLFSSCSSSSVPSPQLSDLGAGLQQKRFSNLSSLETSDYWSVKLQGLLGIGRLQALGRKAGCRRGSGTGTPDRRSNIVSWTFLPPPGLLHQRPHLSIPPSSPHRPSEVFCRFLGPHVGKNWILSRSLNLLPSLTMSWDPGLHGRGHQSCSYLL